MDRCFCCDVSSEEKPDVRIIERNGEYLCEECVIAIEENLEDLAINDPEEENELL
jgi:hypothetical protein